jgi:hypothetical protein
VPKWGFWEWLSYTCIAIAAIILAVDQAVKGSSTTTSYLTGIAGGPIWNYAPAFLVGLSAILIVAQRLGWVGSKTKFDTEASTHVSSSPTYIRTELRLQFFGDQRTPHEISSVNIATWFAYFSPSITLTPQDASGNPLPGGFEVPPSWAIFITVDIPSSYRQATVRFSNPEVMPITEVRMATTRSIVVTARSQFPAGVLEIAVVA